MKEQPQTKHIGAPMNRVDGHLKVTGGAKYSAEYELPNMSYAVLVGSTIAKGRLTSIDAKAAERAPGERSGMALARAHTGWGDAGGWDAEVLWDTCCTIAVGQPLPEAGIRYAYVCTLHSKDMDGTVIVT